MSDEVEGLRLLTTKELAKATGIARWRIHEMASRGEGPPAIRVGRTYRFPVAGVQEWIRNSPDAAIGKPTDILGVLRDLLLEQMSDQEGMQPWCSVQRADYLGRSGRILAEDNLGGDDALVGLLLTMADDTQIKLTVSRAGRELSLG